MDLPVKPCRQGNLPATIPPQPHHNISKSINWIIPLQCWKQSKGILTSLTATKHTFLGFRCLWIGLGTNWHIYEMGEDDNNNSQCTLGHRLKAHNTISRSPNTGETYVYMIREIPVWWYFNSTNQLFASLIIEIAISRSINIILLFMTNRDYCRYTHFIRPKFGL